MDSKIFEIRDRGTTIIAMATQLRPSREVERALFAHSGYCRTSDEQARYFILSSGGHGNLRALSRVRNLISGSSAARG